MYLRRRLIPPLMTLPQLTLPSCLTPQVTALPIHSFQLIPITPVSTA